MTKYLVFLMLFFRLALSIQKHLTKHLMNGATLVRKWNPFEKMTVLFAQHAMDNNMQLIVMEMQNLFDLKVVGCKLSLFFEYILSIHTAFFPGKMLLYVFSW